MASRVQLLLQSVVARVLELWFNAGMTTSEAIREFGSVRKLAAALDLSVQAIYKWGEEVPPLRAYQIRDLIAARQGAEHKVAA